MSRRTVTDCDGCGAKACDARPVWAKVGRQRDAAGSMEDVCENLDLCAQCMAVQISLLLAGLGDELSARWVGRLKRKKT